MKRRAISWALTAVAATIIAVAAGIGASVYYLGAAPPLAQTTESMMPTISTSSMQPSSTQSSTTTTGTMVPTVSPSTTASMSTQSGAESSSTQAAHLKIVAGYVSHVLSGGAVAATCSGLMPAQGESYLEVTNNGTAPADVNNLTFENLAADMASGSGAPTGACTVGAGSTEYVTLTGIGNTMATAGETFTVSLTATNGGYASFTGTFG